MALLLPGAGASQRGVVGILGVPRAFWKAEVSVTFDECPPRILEAVAEESEELELGG